MADVANQATDRLAAQIETGRREVASQSDAAKATAARLVNEAGAWSAEKLKEASAAAADDIRAAVRRVRWRRSAKKFQFDGEGNDDAEAEQLRRCRSTFRRSPIAIKAREDA